MIHFRDFSNEELYLVMVTRNGTVKRIPVTALKNIRNHQEDVPRKLLMLLYVVTENSLNGNDAYRELDESYITQEERVEDHWWTLNAMLADCGMAQLDTRNPFDWLILYAISAEEDEFMSDRMEQVIASLFAEQPQ